MSESSEYVSCFRINGRPILPPVMTVKRRAEMQEYKLKALAIEKKLNERKLMKERRIIESEISKNETFDREGEDKENTFPTVNITSKTLLSETAVIKFPFSERSCYQSYNCDPKILPLTRKDSVIPDNHPDDGASSLAPTDSTDIQNYLDSTLDDVSPDVGSNFDNPESTQHALNNEDYKEQGISRVNAELLAFERNLADLQFSPIVDLREHIPNLISVHKPVKGSSYEKVDTVKENVPNSQDVTVENAPNAEDKEAPVMDGNLKDCSLSCPSRLVRRGSYTLDLPSPNLRANIEKFSVSPKCADLSTSTNDNFPTNETRLGPNQDEKAELDKKSVSKDLTENVEVTNEMSKNRSEPEIKPKKSKMPSKKQSSLDQINVPSFKGSVFERLAADAANKAEQRRRLIKESAFKIPGIKKVSKAVKGLRSAVSVSNIRSSSTEAKRKRSSLLENRRCNSDVNISSVVGKVITSKKKQNSAVSSHVPKKQSSANLNKDSSVNIPKEGLPSTPKKQKYTVQTSPISPPHQKSLLGNVEAVASQKRKRRCWTERWEGWTIPIPTVVDTEQVPPNTDCDQALASIDLNKDEVESSKETTSPKSKIDVTINPKNNHVINVVLEEKSIDLCIDEIAKMGNAQDDAKGSEIGYDNALEECSEKVVQKHKKENDNLLIAKQSSEILQFSKDIPEGNDICENGGELENECNALNSSSDTVVKVASNSKETDEVDPVLIKATSVSDVPLDLDSGDAKVDFMIKDSVEGSPKNKVGKIASPVSPSVELQRTIESLPGTPIGPHRAKDMAFRILGRLVDEQDKAMSNLLEEQRLKAENLQKKFKEQQKYLVGKLTCLLQAIPSPQNKDSTCVADVKLPTQHGQVENDCIFKNSEVGSPNPISFIRVSLSPSQVSTEGEKTLKAVSTPLPFVEERVREKCKANLLTPAISESMSPLSPSNYVDPKSVIGIEAIENCDDTLNSVADLEDFPKIICSFCQVCHTSSNTCKCSSGETSCSSTLKEDLQIINVISNSSKSDGATESISSGEKTVFQLSDCDQKVSLRIVNEEYHDSNSEVTLNSMKSSTTIEDSRAQNVDLDLSDILEMESREKSIPHSPIEQLVATNSLHDTHSSGISSANDSKVKMNNEFLIDELKLHRQKYEEDFWRLAGVEPTPRSPPNSISNCVAKVSPLSIREVTSIEECPLSNGKLSAEHVAKNDIQSSVQVELPDLKGDMVALHTYLGVQTPSTGPVILETPLSTPMYRLNERNDSNLDAENQLTDSIFVNVSQDPVKGWELRQSDVDFLGLKLNFEENEEKDYEYNPKVLMLPISSSPGSKTGSLSENRYITLENSSNSVYNDSATSGSIANNSIPNDSKSEISKRFSKLGALVKGYLTRRLLKTARVLGIKATIRDSLDAALELHSDVAKDGIVNPADVMLHGRILAQLSAACNELHHICFDLPIKDQMAIISADHQRVHSRTSTPIIYDPIVAPSPRPALLSAVTLKTLQRRFGSELPAKKGLPVKSMVKKECNAIKEKSVPDDTKIKTRRIEEVATYVRPTRARSSATFVRQSFIGTSGAGKNSVAKKTSNANIQPKRTKKTRRSSSAGDVNRRPWR